MKKLFLLLILCSIWLTSLMAQEPASKGRIRVNIDGEMTDIAGINAKTRLVTLKNVKASEIEPFVRSRLTLYGTVQVNDAINTLIITELEPKLTDLVKFIKELDKKGINEFFRLETEAISLNYIDPSSIDSILKTRISPDGTIQVHSALNKIIITDVRSKIENIKKIVASLDVPPKQVVITAEVLSVNTEYSKKMGINWHAFPEVFPGTTIDFSVEKGKDIDWQILGSLSPEQLIQRAKQSINDGKASLNFMPKIVVQNNETGTIEIGSGRTIWIGGIEGLEEDFQEESVKDKLTLRVIPRIGEDAITLRINLFRETPEVMAVSNREKYSSGEYGSRYGSERISESTSERFSNPLLSTTVLLKDKETYILAGGQSEVKKTIDTGIPVLKSIPLLGYFFHRKTNVKLTSDVIIFITPRILNFGEKIEKE